jgi:hypothetical protein
VATRLFVDCRGLTSEAQLTTVEGKGAGESYWALLLKGNGWDVDGRAGNGPDGASLAPVQAAVEVDTDRGSTHYWVQELGGASLVIERFEAVRSPSGDWSIDSGRGDKAPFAAADNWDPVSFRDPEGPGAIPLLNSTVGGRGSWLVRWRQYLLSLGSPADPRVWFRGWIWPAGGPGRFPEQSPFDAYVLHPVKSGGPLSRWAGEQAGKQVNWEHPPPPQALQIAVEDRLATARFTAGRAVKLQLGDNSYLLTPELSSDGKSVRLVLAAGHTPEGVDGTGIRFWHLEPSANAQPPSPTASDREPSQ